ncbi:RHS domain-containing protein [Lysinibacillus sp. CD3-6]|uniref:RHS repeat domain-containing protein n=1 Tax=Lysinibacillus sp. CD3-6 TaxID=2892541 RepID=UPI001D17AC89|nr:RHS repeat-associated core domain-containing protein [Lysinibacillus sp. CD3-6]UED78820.1 RHS domain-containing protein [Lysinibacillus sp. CD3-6]
MKYEYYGNGMMSKVIRPDLKEVTFKYDALGRRIEKSSEGRATHFVWDGNTILHEYFSQDVENSVENASKTEAEIADNLVTWVFNDGFVPSAKITSEGNYSIISDYLGTPVEAYDEQGHKVWSAELDVYGRVNEFTGEKDFIPFRYQGQYEDVEIGLYYNRFRYYDPEQGNYTQVDPIGLAGGNPTLYGYVSEPNTWLDPFGLSCGKTNRGTSNRSYDSTKPLSPSNYPNPDPAMSVPPVRYEPKTIEEVIRVRRGDGPTTKKTHGDRNIEAHPRNQIPISEGGVFDELEEYTHRHGGNHTRHIHKSKLTPSQRRKEISDHYKKRGNEYILPGEGIKKKRKVI